MKCPHCLSDIDPAKGSPRSLEQLRRYFAVVRAVYFHWPETHERQFSDEHEFRKWLEMKAGYREIGGRIPLVGIRKEQAMMLAEAAIRSGGSYAIPVIHGSELVIWNPKSIAFGKLSHEAFCKLNDAVDDVIKAETGLDADEVLKQTERAA